MKAQQVMTSKDSEDCSCLIWEESARPARKHLLVSHIISLFPSWGQRQPEPCQEPPKWRGLEAEHSLACVPLALASRGSSSVLSPAASASCGLCRFSHWRVQGWCEPMLGLRL